MAREKKSPNPYDTPQPNLARLSDRTNLYVSSIANVENIDSELNKFGLNQFYQKLTKNGIALSNLFRITIQDDWTSRTSPAELSKILTFYARSVNTPSTETIKQEIAGFGKVYVLPCEYRQSNSITLQVVSDYHGDILKLCSEWQQSDFAINKGKTAQAPIEGLAEVQIALLAQNMNDEIVVYILHNCFISNIGELNLTHTASSPINFNITISYASYDIKFGDQKFFESTETAQPINKHPFFGRENVYIYKNGRLPENGSVVLGLNTQSRMPNAYIELDRAYLDTKNAPAEAAAGKTFMGQVKDFMSSSLKDKVKSIGTFFLGDTSTKQIDPRALGRVQQLRARYFEMPASAARDAQIYNARNPPLGFFGTITAGLSLIKSVVNIASGVKKVAQNIGSTGQAIKNYTTNELQRAQIIKREAAITSEGVSNSTLVGIEHPSTTTTTNRSLEPAITSQGVTIKKKANF